MDGLGFATLNFRDADRRVIETEGPRGDATLTGFDKVGNVVQSYSVLGKGAYQVDDGTGKLWVVSDKGVPRKGARVGVRGKIRDGFDLGHLVKLPEVISSGMVMVEAAHKARY